MKKRTGWLLVAVAAAGAAALVARRRYPFTRIDFNTLDPETALDDGSQFVDIDGLRVRTRSAGQGRPASVLLHGFAASVFTWHKVFERLADHGEVVAFDRPAYGFTSCPSDGDFRGRNPYSLEAPGRPHHRHAGSLRHRAGHPDWTFGRRNGRHADRTHLSGAHSIARVAVSSDLHQRAATRLDAACRQCVGHAPHRSWDRQDRPRASRFR